MYCTRPVGSPSRRKISNALNFYWKLAGKVWNLWRSSKTLKLSPEEEYFKVMQQLLASRSEPFVTSSSDQDSAEPFISLGNDNEDDCFGIFPPITIVFLFWVVPWTQVRTHMSLHPSFVFFHF